MTTDIWAHGKIDARKISDSILFERISEASAWCSHAYRDGTDVVTFRSKELCPPMREVVRDTSVCFVGALRSLRVRTHYAYQSIANLNGDRLMVYFPDATLSDGGAELESDGFYDACNAPPWDTWVAYFEDQTPDISYRAYVVAVVPRKLIELADRGIAANPDQCIKWLSDASVELSKRIS